MTGGTDATLGLWTGQRIQAWAARATETGRFQDGCMTSQTALSEPQDFCWSNWERPALLGCCYTVGCDPRAAGGPLASTVGRLPEGEANRDEGSSQLDRKVVLMTL